ncbi:helix-turn-helix transcriptional regulator [Alicyclobacillus sp. SP_1]|uniref:helix-turn-helix domain-containing protein n=1 Tax=Alicyclobacillus sp. SP_1 TaxID=2942475 RepID=UPI0021571557|nr:helix-turn-helix transcriptional regulator [Alicyclobacillus sp. SP_1]
MIKIHLARILAERHLKQLQLAEMAGVRHNTVNALCNTHNPAVKSSARRIDLDTLNRICDALNIQPGDLLEYIPDEKSSFVEKPPTDADPFNKKD